MAAMSHDPDEIKIDLAIAALSRLRSNVDLYEVSRSYGRTEIPDAKIDNLYRLALAVEFTLTHARRHIADLVDQIESDEEARHVKRAIMDAAERCEIYMGGWESRLGLLEQAAEWAFTHGYRCGEKYAERVDSTVTGVGDAMAEDVRRAKKALAEEGGDDGDAA